MFIYDSVSGGVGFSHAVYHELGPLAEATEVVINNCACDSQTGCPACIMSPSCGSNNEPLDKSGSKYLLDKIYNI